MKLNTTKISPSLLNAGLLMLRVILGGLMIANHGWTKIIKYDILKTEFLDLFGLGSNVSLILAIVGEVLCSLLLILGLYTRFSLIPLIITMLVAIGTHGWDIFGKAELGFLYLIGFIFLLLVGPGQNSIDAKINKRSFY